MRCVDDTMQQILSAAITYEGRLDEYKGDFRVYSHKLTDSIYDTLVDNLKVYQRGQNSLGAKFTEESKAYQLLLKKYPEFKDDSWHYTGGFFY